jgi:hypothetical protein
MKSLLLILCLTAGPTLAAGQGVPQSTPPGDSGGQAAPNASTSDPSLATTPHAGGNTFLYNLEHRGFVGMLLDHRADLQLVGKQISDLSTLEQVFRTQTDSATRQLDSLRKANSRMTKGLSLRSASINSTQLTAFLQAQQTMATLVQRVMTVQRQTKERALVLLTPAQRAQAAALEKQMRQLLTNTVHPKSQANQPLGTPPAP